MTAVLESPVRWANGSSSRIPYAAYTDESVYREELARFFYKDHWCYVGLEAEIPTTGDFKRSKIGERSVIMIRDKDGAINVVENRCAHRGVAFCRERSGNKAELVCPYHQWNYNLKGDLQGVPFRRGIRQDSGDGMRVVGGMPADFDLKHHGLTKLKVAARGGAVFASFDHAVPNLEDYLGPDICRYFDRIFDGRKLVLLGYNRQRIPGNWKLMQENIKDPYHPGLLHAWFVTFGLWRSDNKAQLLMDSKFRHAAMISQRGNAGQAGAATSGVTSFKQAMALNDDRFLDVVHEPWWGEPTAVMTTVFPSLIIQQQVNSLSTRQIIPHGVDSFDFVWTHFGFEDDTPEMQRRRLRQANLFGPAGFVSADDGEVIEFSQDSFTSNTGSDASTVVELGGRTAENTDHMVTETLIRGMYSYWREVMDA